MKKCIWLLAFCCSSALALAQDNDHPDSLLLRRQLFVLRNVIAAKGAQLSERERLYYQAYLDNFFNKGQTSNTSIDLLLQKYRGDLTAKQVSELLQVKIDNLVKAYRYKAAYTCSMYLLDSFKTTLPEKDQEAVRNAAVIWEGLQEIAPQELTVLQDTHIPFKRDAVGLVNIPVSIGDTSNEFVFDTGAGISTITESSAARNHLTPMNKYFDVEAATGGIVKARIAVVKELQIGGIRVKNAVFMVFPDSALTWPEAKYGIKGIIGFPVIEQMGEIRINSKEGVLEVPQQPLPGNYANFGLSNLRPVINVAYKKDSLPFIFDTGATATALNAPFFKKYRKEVMRRGKPFRLPQGGAGGVNTVNAYKLPEIVLGIADKHPRLPHIPVITAPVMEEDKYYYGNLGQDIMKQYREMVISFRYMYVSFKD